MYSFIEAELIFTHNLSQLTKNNIINSYVCIQARYGLKADDDTFMNIFAMADEMSKNANRSSAIICPVWGEKSMPILRDRKNCLKWCVRKRDLPGQTHFPQYCAGENLDMCCYESVTKNGS